MLKNINVCPVCGEGLEIDSSFIEHMRPKAFYVFLYCVCSNKLWRAELSVDDFKIVDPE